MQVLSAKNYRLGDLMYTSELTWVYEANANYASREARKIPLILKTLPQLRQEKARTQLLKQRLESEAQALSNLNHPFIVKVIDYGSTAGTPFLVMRRRSLNLNEYLKTRGKFSLAAAVPLLHNLATALDYAHKQGLLHRDIKPDNILIDLDQNGQALYPYITDFGIAQFEDRGFRTETNQVLGTMAYMPPERWEGKETTKRSDIYSLGLVAYEMLVGQALFRPGEAVNDLMKRVMNPSPEFLESIKSKLSADVAVIILKAIARNPKDRYETATEFVESLGQLLPASQLTEVNYIIARNTREAGLADERTLRLLQEKTKKFPVLWVAVITLSFFAFGIIWAQLRAKPEDTGQNLVIPSEEATRVVAFVPSPTASQEALASETPSPTASASPSPTASPSLTATETATSSPSRTASPSPSPTTSEPATITPTPLPEVNCEGAGWVYHTAVLNDSLSHYAYSLASHPIFQNLNYEQRRAYIISVNPELDFSRLSVGDAVCLPSFPPQYIAIATATVLATGGSSEPATTIGISSGTGNNSNTNAPNQGGSGNGGSGGANSGGGGSGNGGSGGGSNPPTDVPPPTAIPISVSVSASCSNGNSGGTTFRISNNGSTAVSISWRVSEGGNQVASGSLNLAVGESATAWSGTTKNKNYSLTVNETGASSGENCG